jgi:hypothetical protein
MWAVYLRVGSERYIWIIVCIQRVMFRGITLLCRKWGLAGLVERGWGAESFKTLSIVSFYATLQPESLHVWFRRPIYVPVRFLHKENI